MNIRFTLFAMCSFFWCNAQNEKTSNYILQFKNIAMQEMIRTGVPAAITLAQAILESQSGESELVKKTNNHFGIKCKPEWTGAKAYHNDDTKGECFRVYNSADASYIDHSNFLKTRANYAFLFQLDKLDHVSWVYGLKKAGYATSPTYPDRLLKIITEYNLDQYNLLAISHANKLNLLLPHSPIITASSPEITKQPIISSKIDTLIEVEDSAESIISIKSNSTPEAIIHNSAYPSGVFFNNGLQVIYANEGSSMLAIANQFNITLSKLLFFNDMQNIDILPKNQLIYLERKQKEGLTNFYITHSNETIYQIAQITGVRIDHILQYNKFNLSTMLVAGSKIFLRNPHKSTLNTPKY